MLKYFRLLNLSSALRLQLYLNKLVSWGKQNCLPLNINKCSIITFTYFLNYILYNRSIYHTLLSKVNSIKYLEILIDSNMCFSPNIHFFTNVRFHLHEHFKNVIFLNCQVSTKIWLYNLVTKLCSLYKLGKICTV